MILKTLTADEVKDRMKHGLAISDLRAPAVQMGYFSTIGTMTFQQLAQARVPLVVPLKIKDYDHFVVYRGMADGRVYLADSCRGNVRPTVAEFCQQWQKERRAGGGQAGGHAAAAIRAEHPRGRGERRRHDQRVPRPPIAAQPGCPAARQPLTGAVPSARPATALFPRRRASAGGSFLPFPPPREVAGE